MTADICQIEVRPKYYVWSFPGCPIKVRLSLELVREWQTAVEDCRAAPNQEGVLLGSTVEGATEITAHAPIRPGGLPAASGSDSVVGYYRLKPGAGLRLSEEEVSLAKTCFAKPHQVVLAIEPSTAGSATAAFFFWDRGRMNADFCFLEFPLNAAVLEAAENESQATAVLRAQRSSEARAAGARVRRPGRRFRIAAMVFGALLVAAGGGFSGWRFSKGRPRLEQPALVPAPLGLHAEQRNGDLYLTWRRDSEAVQNATGGLLTIRDGGAIVTMPLDGAQVRDGSILYVPSAQQIQMELTVDSPGGKTNGLVIAILRGKGQVETVPLPSSAVPREFAQEVGANEKRVQAVKPWDPNTALGDRVGAGTRQPNAVLAVAPAPPVLAPRADLPEILGRNAVPERPPAPAPAAPGPAPAAAPLEPAPKPTAARAVVTPPVAIRRVSPQFPPAIRAALPGRATVRVRLRIDEAGKILEARVVDSDGTVSKYVEAAAVRAALDWTFRPAQVNGRAVPGEIVLQFRFDPQ